MSLYLGNYGRRKVILNNIVYYLDFIPEILVIYGIKLLSFDNYTLRDANGLYLTSKDGDNYGERI